VSAPFVKAIDASTLAEGGMKAVTIDGHELVVGKANGAFHAIQRACGHMNAPLERGTLVGTIVTCPMHCARFDLLTGAVLCGPVPHAPGAPPPTPRLAALKRNLELMIQQAGTAPLRTCETKLEGGAVSVRLPDGVR
jgi:3-phenylpropionate/trans-cinnamate dioxygenase ferredoxin subunit